jgi:hypothetical protein
MESPTYKGKAAVVVRFFLDELVNDTLPPELKAKLENHLKENAA